MTNLPSNGLGPSRALRPDHRLRIENIELVGGFRSVAMRPGLNIVRGDITTGKTTFVRLIRAFLATVSASLPPETTNVRALQGNVRLRSFDWRVYRPLVTTADAPVEVARVADDDEEPVALRLAATGYEASYSRFMLDQLGLPAVLVPEGSSTTVARLNPVSMSDWLGYCIVTGDELDYEVFGHRDQFRDRKRRIVFELIYGYYDVELSDLNARKRSLELRLNSFDQEEGVIDRFLEGTPFRDPVTLAAELALRRQALEATIRDQAQLAQASVDDGNGTISALRTQAVTLRRERDRLDEEAIALRSQISELGELRRQLQNQSSRLTRAIVADEWLVDFEFLVCPRCGNEVQPDHAHEGICYLCHQPESPGTSQETLLAEQRRVVIQIEETDGLISSRESDLQATMDARVAADHRQSLAAAQLNIATETFVSDRASAIQDQASDRARLETEIRKLEEYDELLTRRTSRVEERQGLETELAQVQVDIASRTSRLSVADENTSALETRFVEYLGRLNIPQLEDTLTARINRTTYMPEVSTRSFDELSSQGLKTLVNVAHALAHHTVAIDRGLPLPGLLILDGLSANVGHQGFDQARVNDLYRLVKEVATEYRDSLQLVVVDNDLPPEMEAELANDTVLELSQNDRLVRSGEPEESSGS